MDDILFAQPTPFLQQQIEDIRQTLAQFQLVIAPEKVQQTAPWKYLGWTLSDIGYSSKVTASNTA